MSKGWGKGFEFEGASKKKRRQGKDINVVEGKTIDRKQKEGDK